jgi:lauroyl/myristoyl acyltransferase
MRTHLLDAPLSYYLILLAVRYLPSKLCHALGRFVAVLIYNFSWKDRDNLKANLSIVFQKPANDPIIKDIVRHIFINYGHYLVDFFSVSQLSAKEAKMYLAEFEGEDILDTALSRGRGVILLSAHLGNWEIGSIFLWLKQRPFRVVSMSHNTRATNDLVNRLRKGRDVSVIEMDSSIFAGIEILRALRNNEIVFMIGDKDFSDRGQTVLFFGKEVLFPVGPVIIAMNSGAALIPTFIFRRPDGRYNGFLEEPISINVGNRNNRQDAINENITHVARVFEKYIRKYPDQWYRPDLIFEKNSL